MTVAGRLAGCRSCGALQIVGAREDANVADCRQCGSRIERRVGRNFDVALACSASTLIMLVPANLLKIMTTTVLDGSLHSYLWSSASATWGEGWPWLGAVVAFVIVVAPLLRFGLLTTVLATLKSGARPRWIGSAFRWAQALEPWAMTDVFLLGLWIAYARLHATIDVVLGPGAFCLIAAGLLTLITRATIPVAKIWGRIAPERGVAGPAITCPACELPLPLADDGGRCPRCQARVSARIPGALEQAAALTLAGLALYVLANIYPMATVPLGLQPHKYTVLQGVIDLFKAHLAGLGFLVLTVSFVVPLIKLLGLSWCVASVVRGSRRHLREKTTLYHLIEEVGRWSMTDPLAIACFVPVMQYNALVYARADAGASVFSFVVIVTMAAARRFDPRLLWDGAAE